MKASETKDAPMSQELDIELEEEALHTENLDAMMEPFDPSEIDVVSETLSLDAIIERMRHNEIDMNTDFQREAELWKADEMSRLIESVLIRFPLPVFYFDASDNDQWLIVDGLQRLSAIKKFVIDEELSLTGLEFLKELKGKKYSELHRSYQRRLKECQILTYQIRPGTPEEVKYSIFRRINTGGMRLNNQEIRHAMSKPRERKFLKACAHLPIMQKLMPNTSKRMQNQELALRFCSFYLLDYEQARKDLAHFLDMGLAELSQKSQAEQAALKQLFADALASAEVIFGERAFEKQVDQSAAKRRKNASLFEVWSVSLAQCNAEEREVLRARGNQLKHLFAELLHNDAAFFDAISYHTQKPENVRIRYAAIRQLIAEVLHA